MRRWPSFTLRCALCCAPASEGPSSSSSSHQPNPVPPSSSSNSSLVVCAPLLSSSESQSRICPSRSSVAGRRVRLPSTPRHTERQRETHHQVYGRGGPSRDSCATLGLALVATGGGGGPSHHTTCTQIFYFLYYYILTHTRAQISGIQYSKSLLAQ